MGFGDFQLNNNGKREQLRDVKQGVRKEQLDKKYHALFDVYDANNDGTLEANELNGILKGLQSFAGADKVLDSSENLQAKSIFASHLNIQDVDFQGFVNSVSTASDDIVSSKENPTSDGGKEVTTTYKDGTVETISYYPDGDYKFKKLDKIETKTTIFYTIGDSSEKYTPDEIKIKVQNAYKESVSKKKKQKTLDGSPKILIPDYDMFKQEFMQLNNINQGSETHKIERHDFELSERGKQDVAIRDFVLNEYIETHQAAKEALASMGFLDDTGALINAGAGELWNSIKNVWNGTEEEYQNFYELLQKFSPGVIQEKIKKNIVKTAGTVGNILTLNSNFSSALTTIFDKISNDETSEMGSYEKSLQVKEIQELAQQHPENYFRGEIGQIDTEKGAKFQQVTEQYQNAQILNTRLNILKEAMHEVALYDAEKTSFQYSSMPDDVDTSISHILKANGLLLQYFGGDQEAVDMILNGAMGDNNSKVVKAIKDIYEETQKMNTAVLGGKSFDEVRSDYQNQYKEMYGTDFVPDELTEKVMDAKATGSMIKLAAITIISILITRSPMMAEINGAIAGSAEATGAAANLMRTLVAKYGQTAVTRGVKFAMTTGTLATDVGLTLLNQVTSERGVDGQELWESAKGSAKYIYFGAYIGTPVAEAVGRAVGKIGLANGLMSGGVTTTQGAIKTTTLTGDKVFENILNTGKGIGQKLTVNGAKFGTDVAMFSALGIATDGQEIGEAFEEQATFLPKLKIMNHVLEYVMGRVLGGKVGAQPSLTSRPQDVRMETAIEKSGIKDWTIKEMKSPSGTRYTVVDEKGIPQNFNDVNKLVTAMMERVAKTYETVAPKAQEAAENKGETKVRESEQTEYRNSQESAILSRLETANDRETFVAIRDEINKMPAGKEKTQLMKEYLKKYNEWSASTERPDIRMQYMPEENGNNNLHLMQINFDLSVFTTEEISLNLKRIEKKYGAEIVELLEIDEYATEIIGEVQKAITAKNYSFAIEENGIFTPYKLSLIEIHEIKSALVADINGHIDIFKIDTILKENNPELFNKYGSTYKYSDQLNQLSKTLSNLDMYDGVIPKKYLGIEINGNRKYIRTSENIPKGTVKDINYTELIESNMLTLECISVFDKQGIEIPENKKLRTYNTAYKTNSKTETITLDIETVINKAKVEGIGALSSFEIHALTDTFVDLFNSNGKFQTALKNESMDKANTIYSYVNGIKSEANRVLQGSNLEIRDHCIMRIIDRDVYSVVNNKEPGKMVSFTDMIKTIKERATALIKENQKSGKTDFSFIIYEFGGGGLEIKIKFISNGKYEIDTIIQK